jgi:tRNA threonylcarbamoyl adenosine modification protein YeaZ
MDSSGPVFLAGINAKDRVYSSRRKGIKQERFFLPVIERVLKKAGCELADVKKIFFVRGPGRFTGIRISLTFASMLQALNGAEVSGATLFEILHKQVTASVSFSKWKKENKTGTVAIVLHAFREEYFLQFFDKENAGPQWLAKEELLQKLAAHAEPLYIAGTDRDGLPLSGLLGNSYRLAAQTDSRLRVETLLEMAENPIYCKNALEPLYLKPARFELGK